MKDYYCECNAPCIYQKGIKVIYINDKAVKVSGCGNQRKDCNCKYRRPYLKRINKYVYKRSEL